MTVEATFRVDRPVAEIYEFLVETANFSVVDKALVRHEPAGRMEPGMHGTMEHRRVGMQVRTSWWVALLEPPTRLVVGIRGAGYELDEEVQLRGTDGMTELHVIDRLWGTSRLGDLFVALAAGPLRRDLRARGDRLRAVLGTPTEASTSDR
jgi:hypothetical protein